MNIYVGNLSWKTTVAYLRHVFEGFGEVTFANIIRDKVTGISRGFGFIEMPNEAEAHAAISDLNGKELEGRRITVDEARPHSEGRQRS